MKAIVVLLVGTLCGILVSAQDPVNLDYVDYLKKTVSWKVEDYNNNIFKGWSLLDVKKLFGDTYVSNADENESEELELESLEPDAETAGAESMELGADTVDWSFHRCTHGIPSQGQCGGCWAFVVAGVTSDRCCLRGGDFGWLSVQELISCNKENFGCVEGSRATGLEYVKKNGLVPESCFPYAGKEIPCPATCVNGRNWAMSHVCRCDKIRKCIGEHNLMRCLKSGPVAGGMAIYVDFLYYKEGIYRWNREAELMGYHSVRIVGYGPGYWKCANSWGSTWGMGGYFMIARGECDLEKRAPSFCDIIR